jgi:hypothetical protein
MAVVLEGVKDQMLMLTIWKKFDNLFPAQQIYHRKLSIWQIGILLILFTLLFTATGFILPADGFIGFDWVNFWEQGIIPEFYPPWTGILVENLTWELLIGLSLSAYAIAVLRRASRPTSAVYAFMCLPLLWTLFLGQLDGIALLGVIGLPWLAPLALVKPQVAVFAFGARKNYLIGLIFFVILSIILWGPWMLRTMSVETYYAEGRYLQNIGLGMFGVPITLLTIWFSRGDPDMLMLSGVFIMPHIIPYNFLPLSPSLARLRPRNAFIGFVLSWLPFSANWFGPIGWYLGWLFVIWLWLNLAAIRYPDSALLRWLR